GGPEKIMNIALWTAQILLALAFSLTGGFKRFASTDKLMELMGHTDLSERNLRLISIAELLGVVGIILPKLTGIWPVLTFWAAVGFLLLMICAGIFHLWRSEYTELRRLIPLFLLAAFVVYGRWPL
ncbi:MAG: DoxX family protein, partial [Anaerolineales bacterium]|nr:DoxX family protein [Anaerolineales bacterium]